MIAGGSKCCFAGGYNGECGGTIRWHHPLKQQRLKREFKYGARRAFTNEPWKAAGRTLPVTTESRAKWPFTELLLTEILGDTPATVSGSATPTTKGCTTDASTSTSSPNRCGSSPGSSASTQLLRTISLGGPCRPVAKRTEGQADG